jgi:hypothetical protein
MASTAGCGGFCPARAPADEPVTVASLTGTDLYHWIALRRVLDGEVTKLNGCWRYHGHLVPGYVTDALDELLMGGLVTLADPDLMVDGRALAALTNSGIARFEELCRTVLGVHLPAQGRSVDDRAGQGR